VEQDPSKLGFSDRMKLSAQGGSKVQLAESLSDAIAFVVLEKSYDLKRLRKLDVASFMVLLQFVEKQAQVQKKAMAKAKSKSKRR